MSTILPQWNQEQKEAHQKALTEAMGTDQKEFSEKMTWLKNRWKGQAHSTETVLIAPIINSTTPLNTALVADNLDYFHKAYNKTKLDPEQNLARACLCGSQKIAEFLLTELNLSYLTIDSEHDFILGYVAASNNIEWTKNVATTLANSGREMSDSIYGLGTPYETIDMVKEIFKNKDKNNTSSDEKRKSETKRPSGSTN